MKKLLPILLLLGSSSVAYAGGMTTRHQSSLQQIQTPSITTTERVGNTYSISGTNVSTEHTPSGENASAVTGGVGILSYDSNGVGSVGSVAVTQSQGCSTTNNTTTCSGGSFSFSQSFTQGDAINGASTTWGDITTYTQGSAGTGVPGTIDNAHTITLSQGTTGNPNLGAGNSLTGQFVSEITIFD